MNLLLTPGQFALSLSVLLWLVAAVEISRIFRDGGVRNYSLFLTLLALAIIAAFLGWLL